MPSDEQKSIFLQELEKEEGEKEVKLENNPEKKNKVKKKMSATALFATIFILFLVLIALFIFIMSIGGAGNPILKTFGVPEDEAKKFLLGLVNWTFGTIGVILFLTFSISLFIGFSTKKEEKIKRRGTFIFSAVNLGLIFFSIMFWLGTWSFVNTIVVEASMTNLKIEIDVPDPENIVAPIDVTFSVEKIHDYYNKKGLEITGFKWDFGTGSFLSLQTEDKIIQHFETYGSFTIRVQLVGEDGKSDIYTREFEIPKAEFAVNPVTGNAPLRVDFDATAVTKDMSPEIFDWDFDGDSVFEENTSSPKTSHTFEKIGKYRVNLRVVDSNGSVKKFNREITVKGEDTDRIQAKIKVYPSSEGSPPFQVKLDGSESFSTDSKITVYEWDFNDGTTKDSGKEVDHVFKKEGNFQVKLSIRDEFGSERTGEQEIIVKKLKTAPEAVIRTNVTKEDGKISGTIPLFIKFDANGSTDEDNNIVKYEWDFDGNEDIDATGTTAEYIFRDIGQREVSLIITDADGNIDTETILIEINKQKIIAEIVAKPETGPAPLTVKFDGSSSRCDETDCHIVSFEWDFGDDTKPQLAGAQIQHLYNKIGIYDVKMKIFTSNGESASTATKIFVREIPLTACFEPSRSTGIVPLTVSFDPSCSVGPVEQWHWDFGDGVIAKTRIPNHTFQVPGKYETILKIFDDKNNVSEVSREIEVVTN